MIILCDMDGCLVDWGASWNNLLDRVRHLTNLGYSVPKHEHQISFNLKLGLDGNESRVVDYLMDNLDYAGMEPMPGAIEALHEMVANGHTVRLLSTPTVTNPKCASDKYDWVAKNLGSEWASNLILCHEKWMVRGDVLIDDRPDIPNADLAPWQQILFSQPYNVDSKLPRINNWSEWERVFNDNGWTAEVPF